MFTILSGNATVVSVLIVGSILMWIYLVNNRMDKNDNQNYCIFTLFNQSNISSFCFFRSVFEFFGVVLVDRGSVPCLCLGDGLGDGLTVGLVFTTCLGFCTWTS